MTIKTYIGDGKGKGVTAQVSPDGDLYVASRAIPPVDLKSDIRIFRQYLTDDGTASGSNDMRVNGSSTNVDFYVSAPSDADRYIDTISIAIADAGAPLNEFGNIGVLTNGVEIFYEDSTLGDVTIAEDLVSNFEFLRMCGPGIHGIGTGSNSYRANNVQGNSEGFLMTLDFSETFGVPWGIRLVKNSTLRLVVRIKDNVSGVDKFDMIAYGYDRIIKDD